MAKGEMEFSIKFPTEFSLGDQVFYRSMDGRYHTQVGVINDIELVGLNLEHDTDGNTNGEMVPKLKYQVAWEAYMPNVDCCPYSAGTTSHSARHLIPRGDQEYQHQHGYKSNIPL